MNTIWIVIFVALVVYVGYRMIPAKGVRSVGTDGLADLLKDKKANYEFVDVREPGEFARGHVPGFKNIPLSQLKQRVNEIPSDRPVVLMCRSGNRSMQAARILKKNGYSDVTNVVGGMMRWRGSVQK